MDTDSTISEKYLENVQKAANAVGNLANIYEETTKALKTDTNSYNDQLNKLNQNLTSINTMYEMQMKNTESMAKANKSVMDSMNNFANTLNASLANAEMYKKEVDQLTKNVAKLSGVYGKMVAAMNVAN